PLSSPSPRLPPLSTPPSSLFLFMPPPPPRPTLFPYTTLFRSRPDPDHRPRRSAAAVVRPGAAVVPLAARARIDRVPHPARRAPEDRKSTRLNSSHLGISYAVFCLKKKKKTKKRAIQIQKSITH